MKGAFSSFQSPGQLCGAMPQQPNVTIAPQDTEALTEIISEALQPNLIKLPLLEHFLKRHIGAIKQLTDPSEVLVVFFQHYFFSTIEMLLTINALGVPRSQIFCMGKCYSFSPSVHYKMLELGFKSYGARDFDDVGAYYDAGEEATTVLLEDASKLCRERKLKTAIFVDDGGLMLSMVSKFDWGEAKLSGVIQTSRGWYEWFNRGGYDTNLPVVDMSYSAAKIGLEYAFVTEGIMDGVVRELLSNPKTLNSISVCGIIGLGNLGRQVAIGLHQRFNHWRFVAFDPKNQDGTKEVELEPGFKVTLTDMETVLASSELLAGCSGSDGLAKFKPLAENLVLGKYGNKTMFSVSSGDIEFLTVLKSGRVANGWQTDSTSSSACFSVLNNLVHVADNGVTLSMLRGGYPINLRNDGNEPLGFQLTRTLLCASVVQAIKLANTKVSGAKDSINTAPKTKRAIEDNCYPLEANYQLEAAQDLFYEMNQDHKYFTKDTEQNFNDLNWIAAHSKNQAYLIANMADKESGSKKA